MPKFREFADTSKENEAIAFEKTLAEIAKLRKSDWKDTYKVISPIAKTVLNIDMTTEQFCALMILLKLIRFDRSGYVSQDCLLDICNYARMASGVVEEKILEKQKAKMLYRADIRFASSRKEEN